VATVSPGHMGGAIGRALASGGVRVVATTAGRSQRTVRLADGLELLPTLDDVVGAADLVLSVVPPAEAVRVARSVATAAHRTGNRPLVADLNAIAPATLDQVAWTLMDSGLDLVDGSISGGPPKPGDERPTRIYLAGPRAAELTTISWPDLDVRILSDRTGDASALKMCSASVYKGLVALGAEAMLTAHHHGVLDTLLDELKLGGLPLDFARSAAVAATKSDRYVPEMREIATTQAGAGLTPALFLAMAEVWTAIGKGPLADEDPETVDRTASPADIVSRLLP
jgi:3-hydroxyisobutyrate dehydrogenase-like beta-hydroxyacid dehydrogenase